LCVVAIISCIAGGLLLCEAALADTAADTGPDKLQTIVVTATRFWARRSTSIRFPEMSRYSTPKI
jgi:outer membrane cobalamin receptor